MASILEKFGIKEVCDFAFYEINADGTPGAPVLYLDSLKVSTAEQTADQTEARGGESFASSIKKLLEFWNPKTKVMGIKAKAICNA